MRSVSLLVVGDGEEGKKKVTGRGKSEVWRFVRVFVFEGGRRRVSGRDVGMQKESGDRPQLEGVGTVGGTVARLTLSRTLRDKK